MTVESERRALIRALDIAIPELREAEALIARKRASLERERSLQQGLLNRMLETGGDAT